LGLPEGATPFPWQEELFTRFLNGTIERSLDIPTGLGKTAVIAIWLIARAAHAQLPRRLVYVVDRRAVVDQATDVANEVRAYVDREPELRQSLGLARSLPISTLRGQHVDNKEWLEDPASPAIIVGTVDLIGSRLLFEGYGTSRKMRPYHAGLLGADTLVVLDEAHLVPPFEKLIATVADGGAVFGPRDEALRKLVPPFNLLSLSATGRALSGTSFGLQDADLKHPVLKQRLIAPKRLVVHPIDDPKKLTDVLAAQAWQLAGNGTRAVRCIVFCDKRRDATGVKAAIDERAKGDKKHGIPEIEVDTQLFVGGRRVFEREGAAQWLKDRGFIAGTNVERARPAFVFATSAGEVGVDLDADHMVSDLVAWERMVQRLGRVNRRGDGDAHVVVVAESPSKEVEDARRKGQDDRTPRDLKALADADRKGAVRQLLDRLPHENDARDVSLRALSALKVSAQSDAELRTLLDAATTPAPLRPALSRALIESWSMTSLKEHTGRPEIDPWIRGWVESDGPQTAVVWRTHLPVRLNRIATRKEVEGFFEAAPPHATEILETETFRVIEWLATRTNNLRQQSAGAEKSGDSAGEALRADDVVAIALTPAGDLRQTLLFKDFDLDGRMDAKSKKEKRERLEGCLMGATLVLDARLRGLKAGLLDDDYGELPRTADDGAPWISAAPATSRTVSVPVVPFRVRSVDAENRREIDTEWQECFFFATEVSEDGEPIRGLIVENAATEEGRSTGPPQVVDEHQAWTEQRARELARRLRLPDRYTEMLAMTASLHDEGKRAPRWQRAFNAKRDGRDYAKTRGPINYALLDGYRHEFGSLTVAAKDPRFAQLPGDLQDLALHLIAAHHGFARPVIGTSGCEDAPSALEEREREVALRFAQLQKRWGPWGLAWWEALLRAADQQASRANDERDPTAAKEGI
jgi:CRISPR-associated endonuclease/helicase Cas3